MGLQGDVTLPGGAHVPRKALAITAAAAAAFVLWRYAAASRGGGAAAADASAGDSYGLAGASGQPEYSGGGGSGSGSGSPSVPDVPGAGSDGVTTNAQWTQSGVDYLAGLGYDSSTVAAALSRYLSGSYTEADRTIITTALGTLGTPPTGVYGWPTIQPATAPTAPATPTPATPTPAAPATPTPATPTPAAPATGGTGSIGKPTIGGAPLGKVVTLTATDNWNTIASKTGRTLDQLRAANGGSLTSALLGKGKVVKY